MMRTSPTRRLSFYAAVFCAACNGRLQVLDDPVGNGAGDLTAGGSDGSTSGGSCDLDQWRPGHRDTPRPIDCGVCSCAGGELVCDERPCLPERSVVECPVDPYFFETTIARGSDVVGQKYHLEVMGPGGCGEEDYLVCYVPPNRADNPLGGFALRVLTSPEAGACDTVKFQSFEVDLTPLESFLDPGSGLISIGAPGSGYAIFGELSCDDYLELARRDVSNIQYYLDRQARECQVDSDCVGLWGYTSCTYNGCLLMATNVEDSIGLRDELASIDAARCQPYFEAGCAPPPEPACDDAAPPSARCDAGRCILYSDLF